MASKHEEPCDVAHCSKFMDSLVNFLNEAGICMYQVKSCLGMTPGCSAMVKMNDEEKMEKLNLIINTLNIKCKEELNKENEQSQGEGNCPPSCTASPQARDVTAANASLAPSTSPQPRGSPNVSGGRQVGGVSMEGQRSPAISANNSYIRGTTTPRPPPSQNSPLMRRPMTPAGAPTMSSIHPSPGSPGSPSVHERNVFNASQPYSPGSPASRSAHQRNAYNIDDESCAEEDGPCPGATPQPLRHPQSPPPAEGRQAPANATTLGGGQAYFGGDQTEISPINALPSRPVYTPLRQPGEPLSPTLVFSSFGHYSSNLGGQSQSSSPAGGLQAPANATIQGCGQACFGADNTEISPINHSPNRRTNAPLRSPGGPPVSPTSNYSSFGYASRLGGPPSYSERFFGYPDTYKDEDENCDCNEEVSSVSHPSGRSTGPPTFPQLHDTWSRDDNTTGFKELPRLCPPPCEESFINYSRGSPGLIRTTISPSKTLERPPYSPTTPRSPGYGQGCGRGRPRY